MRSDGYAEHTGKFVPDVYGRNWSLRRLQDYGDQFGHLQLTRSYSCATFGDHPSLVPPSFALYGLFHPSSQA
ncbi:hypothetical protein BST61_g5024 [Cercospora zeina]